MIEQINEGKETNLPCRRIPIIYVDTPLPPAEDEAQFPIPHLLSLGCT